MGPPLDGRSFFAFFCKICHISIKIQQYICIFKEKNVTLQPIMFWYHVTISYN